MYSRRSSLFFTAIVLFLLTFILVEVSTSSYSPIAADVDTIDGLIQENKKRKNTVKFLKDPKNWTNLLEKAAILDTAGIIAVEKEVLDILSTLCSKKNVEKWFRNEKLHNVQRAFGVLGEMIKSRDDTFKEFDVKNYIAQIVEFLEAYD